MRYCLLTAWMILISSRVVRPQEPESLPAGAIARIATTQMWHPGVGCLVFSPDGKMLYSAGNATIRRWDVATGKERGRTLADPKESWGSALALSPDGKWLATPNNGNVVHLLDAMTLKSIRQFTGEEGRAICGVTFSPDSKQIATESWDSILRWVVTTGEKLPRLNGKCQPYLSYSPDGKIFRAGGSTWDLRTGKHTEWQSDDDFNIFSRAHSPDGKVFATGHRDHGIRLWDGMTQREQRHLLGHTDSLRSLSFSPDGQLLASGADDATVRLWAVSTGKERFCLEGHLGDIHALAFSPDGRVLASAGSEGRLILWDLHSGKELHRPEGGPVHITHLAFSLDGKTLATAGSTMPLRFWNPETGKALRQLGVPTWRIEDLVWSPDGKQLAILKATGSIHLWDVGAGKEVRRFTREKLDFRQLAFTPDGRSLAAAGEGLCIWEVASGKSRVFREYGHSFFRSVVCSPDGKWLATSNYQHGIVVWDTFTGKPLRELGDYYFGSVGDRDALALAPDGRLLATVGGNLHWHMILWNVRTGQPMQGFDGHSLAGVVVFSPDGRMLATGNVAGEEGLVKLWEVSTRRLRHVFRGHPRNVSSLSFSPDGHLLASAHNDGTALVWSIGGQPATRATLTHPQLKQLWAALEGEDSVRAYQAQFTLVGAAESSIPFLTERLQSLPAIRPQWLGQLVAALDANRFQARQKVGLELVQLGETVLPALQTALADRPTLEARRRMEQVVEKIQAPDNVLRHPVWLAGLRGVEVLERIGNAEARTLLRTLVRDGDGSLLAREAEVALKRLTSRSAP